jgi:hypothetical protein
MKADGSGSQTRAITLAPGVFPAEGDGSVLGKESDSSGVSLERSLGTKGVWAI